MDLYHVLNRGVDKRSIVMNDKDRLRFVRDLYEMNDSQSVRNSLQRVNIDIGCRYRRKILVHIHGWCLMNNHYHLLLSEAQEHGISLFLQKLNMGYAKYFNEKYKRVGALFQGKTKRKLIDSDAYLLHILNYIHFNPLDFHAGSSDWRERRIENARGALEYLSKYRWSSYRDYMGENNFGALITTSFMQEAFDDYSKQALSYIMDIENEYKKIAPFALE